MKQKIQAGLLGDVTKAVKSISETLFKFLDKFDDYKIEVTKEQELDNGAVKMWCKYDDTPFGMIITPVLDVDQKKTGKFNVLVRCNNKDNKFENISDLDIEKNVIDLLKKEINLGAESGDENASANSSKRLQVTLQRVTSTTSCAINLTSVNANFDSISANELLDTVLDNDEFLDTITSEPVSFEITDCGDSVNIKTIEEFSTSNVFHSLLSKALMLWGMFSKIHWNAHGENFVELHRLTDEYRHVIMGDIDMFGELAVEFNCTAENPVLFSNEDVSPTINCDYDNVTPYMNAIDLIQSIISEYIGSLELYYVDFPSDVQSELDRCIRYWKKERDYFIKQCLK